MKKVLVLALLALFLLGVQALPATSHPGSYTNSDGYWVYPGDGYYWHGNTAYTRTWLTTPGYYAYGRYYAGTGYWQYAYHHTYTAPAYVAPAVAYTDPGWRSRLLDLAAQRDKAEAQIRKGAFEQAYFKEAVGVLGLQGNFRWEGYGAAPPYLASGGAPALGYGNLNLSSAGVNGNTLYGYSYNSIANLYGSNDLATLYQQANRLAENAQKLGGQATTDFGALVSQEGGNRARVAEILARSQAAREVLQSLEQPSGKVETRTFSFKTVQGADGQMRLERVPEGAVAPAALEVAKAWERSATQCLGCHSGNKKDGGFDVTTYRALAAEQKLAVIGRLTTSDPSKRMPRSADGKGVALPLAEVALWLQQ